MDATKLIEEAEIWAREIHASAFPDGAYWGEKFAELAAALKASEERARKAETLAAANVAANKRIVTLEHERDAARAEFARLTTPRPIAEAPRDGTWIGALWEDMTTEDCVRFGPIAVVRWRGEHWEDSDHDTYYQPPSHYLSLPEVKP